MLTVVERVLPQLKLVTATLMLAHLLWIAPSLSGAVGAHALQLVAVATKLVAVPLLHLLLTADTLALLHWQNNMPATLFIVQCTTETETETETGTGTGTGTTGTPTARTGIKQTPMGP